MARHRLMPKKPNPHLEAAQQKTNLKNAILRVLYDPYMKRRTRMFNELIAKNMTLQATPVEGFTYRGQYYGTLYKGAIVVKPKLHPDLHETMEVLLREHDTLNTEELPPIENYLAKVMTESPSIHDWFSLLPEIVRKPVKELMQYQYTVEQMLPQREVLRIQEEHAHAIDLMKQRMAANLIYV